MPSVEIQSQPQPQPQEEIGAVSDDNGKNSASITQRAKASLYNTLTGMQSSRLHEKLRSYAQRGGMVGGAAVAAYVALHTPGVSRLVGMGDDLAAHADVPELPVALPQDDDIPQLSEKNSDAPELDKIKLGEGTYDYIQRNADKVDGISTEESHKIARAAVFGDSEAAEDFEQGLLDAHNGNEKDNYAARHTGAADGKVVGFGHAGELNDAEKSAVGEVIAHFADKYDGDQSGGPADTGSPGAPDGPAPQDQSQPEEQPGSGLMPNAPEKITVNGQELTKEAGPNGGVYKLKVDGQEYAIPATIFDRRGDIDPMQVQQLEEMYGIKIQTDTAGNISIVPVGEQRPDGPSWWEENGRDAVTGVAAVALGGVAAVALIHPKTRGDLARGIKKVPGAIGRIPLPGSAGRERRADERRRREKWNEMVLRTGLLRQAAQDHEPASDFSIYRRGAERLAHRISVEVLSRVRALEADGKSGAKLLRGALSAYRDIVAEAREAAAQAADPSADTPGLVESSLEYFKEAFGDPEASMGRVLRGLQDDVAHVQQSVGRELTEADTNDMIADPSKAAEFLGRFIPTWASAHGVYGAQAMIFLERIGIVGEIGAPNEALDYTYEFNGRDHIVTIPVGSEYHYRLVTALHAAYEEAQRNL